MFSACDTEHVVSLYIDEDENALHHTTLDDLAMSSDYADYHLSKTQR